MTHGQAGRSMENNHDTVFYALLREHQDLARILNALAKLSAMQSNQLSESDWHEVLERKALLLDEIEKRNTRTLSHRTDELVEKLRCSGQENRIAQMQELAQSNRERLYEIQQTELAAQQALELQVDGLRQTLSEAGKGRQASHAYANTLPQQAHGQSRFIDDTL